MGYNRLILDNLIGALNNKYVVRADKIHGPSRYEKKYYAFTVFVYEAELNKCL